MAIAPGTRLGPYEVLSPLGAGGMGEVFRARDTRLGRDVALKVLPDQLASDRKALARFESEAKAVAALSHPNILALFDVGVTDGIPYTVTELLEGETLRALVAHGPVPLKRALDIAHQVAAGLAAAHEKGIVHRDLKPENVFLTKDGHAKILDFGLARHETTFRDPNDSHSPTVSAFTDAGAVLGTISYMSPEQARGLSADHRSDQFSLGIVLYEMLAGKRPFSRETTAETLTAIIREEPEPLEAVIPGVPPPLLWMIGRCLTKSPGERYDSTRDLARDLSSAREHLTEGITGARPAAVARPRRSRFFVLLLGAATAIVVVVAGSLVLRSVTPPKDSAGSPRADRPRIVVLPFENLGAPEDAYFASGITEEITSRLANVSGLAVISRTTATEYPRKGKTVRQVGDDLGVGWVLEGTIRYDRRPGGADRVRITPQLIRVKDDTHAWADRYDRDLADIFTVQSEVATRVVEAIGMSLLPEERSRIAERPTSDLVAYDHYLRGLAVWRRSQERRETEGAVQAFEAAVARDPSFAPALAFVAISQLAMRWHRYDDSEERLQKSRAAADAAVRLRPDLSESHLALGYVLYWGDRDYAGAIEEFERARQFRPEYPEAFSGLANVYRRLGRWEESATKFGESRKLDPRNANLLANQAQSLILCRRYAEADEAWSLATAVSPDFGMAQALRAWLQIQWRGDVTKARELLYEAATVPGLQDATGQLVLYEFRIALARNDLAGALRPLDAYPGTVLSSQWWFLPVDLLRSQVHALAGRSVERQRTAEAARAILEAEVRKHPDDARLHLALGVAYALLDRNAEALRSTRKAVTLMPSSKDAWIALRMLEDVALVCTMTGQHDEAIRHIGTLLSESGEFTAHIVRLDPRFGPLRNDPGLKALLATYQARP